jgi:hypothetical protein
MAFHFAASDRPSVRSHVPGIERDRAQAEEAGIQKAKPPSETPSAEIRRWAAFLNSRCKPSAEQD